ncbi:hypothetical protein [Bacillus cereus]|uniref:hypothetical protein n=1 Tax=Bacillus cereus TaxID=1396 RepID=UPI00027AB6E3|nr:hypothetical protein [Bacillus cereus]EJS63426.1 hypothetical protein ICY_05263 [Bacillus cereus BAG2X1-3]
MNISKELLNWREQIQVRLEEIREERKNVIGSLELIDLKIGIIEDGSKALREEDKNDFQKYTGLDELYQEKKSLTIESDEVLRNLAKEERYISSLFRGIDNKRTTIPEIKEDVVVSDVTIIRKNKSSDKLYRSLSEEEKNSVVDDLRNRNFVFIRGEAINKEDILEIIVEEQIYGPYELLPY